MTVARMSFEKMKYALIARFGSDDAFRSCCRRATLGFGAA
jgi:hypothetical protein